MVEDGGSHLSTGLPMQGSALGDVGRVPAAATGAAAPGVDPLRRAPDHRARARAARRAAGQRRLGVVSEWRR